MRYSYAYIADGYDTYEECAEKHFNSARIPEWVCKVEYFEPYESEYESEFECEGPEDCEPDDWRPRRYEDEIFLHNDYSVR